MQYVCILHSVFIDTLRRKFVYVFLTSHSVKGIVKIQSVVSDMASVTMNTFLAVRIRLRPRTAVTISRFPQNPTIIAKM